MTGKPLTEQLAEARAELARAVAAPPSQERDSDIDYWMGRIKDIERGIEIERTGLPIPESLRYFFKYNRRLPVNQAALRRN